MTLPPRLKQPGSDEVPAQIPDYLRIHVDDSQAPRKLPPADDVSSFWQAYVDATGWRIDKSNGGVAQRPKLLPATMAEMDDIESIEQQPAVSRNAAERLAAAAQRIAGRLREFEGSLTRMEGELAVQDVQTAGTSTDAHIADRLRLLLEDTLAATDATAAGLYMLDDETSSLKLRACCGLPSDRLSETARPLRGALGDLEALVSDVVAIEDLERMTHWQSPEDYASAIVVAVRSAGLPIGTLWLWDDRRRDFSSTELAVAKLSAGSLAAELDRASIAESIDQQSVAKKQLNDASEWQQRQLPSDMPLARGWEVSGWTQAASPLSGEWYGWDVLPDATIALTLASSGFSGVEAALNAASVRAAWQAHAGYRHGPGDLLRRINDTLWQSSTGVESAHVLYAKVDPETGEGHFASAGNCQAFVINRYGYRPVTSASHPLGTDPDQQTPSLSFRLLPGDAFVIASQGVLQMPGVNSQRLSQHEFCDLIREHMASGPESVLAAMRRETATLKVVDQDRSVVVLVREPTA